MIHKYELFGNFFVLDVESGSVHIVDELGFNMLDYIDFLDKEYSLKVLLEKFYKFDKEEIFCRFKEFCSLYDSGMLYSEFDAKIFENVVSKSFIKAICLHVAHDCNLRCKYCFASTGDFNQGRELMNFETAKKAIDFVIASSKNIKNLEVDFFGGEPLLNFEVVKKTIEYAKEKEKKHEKNFRFTITTNGVLLDDEKSKFLNENMNNIVLSIDGRKDVNDKMRVFRDGIGSYELIIQKFIDLVKIRKNKDYYVRGTFTKYNLDFSKDIFHFYEKGFENISVEPVVCSETKDYAIRKKDIPRIFEEYENIAKKIIEEKNNGKNINFFHFNIDLSQGPCIIKRLRGCGSGCEYVAISPKGDIYPCHQFVGDEKYYMGNLFKKNFNTKMQEIFSKTNLLNKKECEKCWAKYYCGGGCNANNYKYSKDILTPYSLGCIMEKKRVECAIAVNAAVMLKKEV